MLRIIVAGYLLTPWICFGLQVMNPSPMTQRGLADNTVMTEPRDKAVIKDIFDAAGLATTYVDVWLGYCAILVVCVKYIDLISLTAYRDSGSQPRTLAWHRAPPPPPAWPSTALHF